MGIDGGDGNAAPTEPSLLTLTSFSDRRGVVTVGEVPIGLPFVAVRFFVVSGVPPGEYRAEHAQRYGDEVLCCVSGSCVVEVAGADGDHIFVLDDPRSALYVPPLNWLRCRDFSAGSLLLVLASRRYDETEVIADRQEALRLLKGGARR